MNKMMKVAVMKDIMKTEYLERNIPTPNKDEVLVKVEYVGVCGSDLHYYETGAIGPYIVKPPFVLGHECSGTVVEVGVDVSYLSVGDRVALEPGKTCGKCHFCKTGDYHLCADVEFFATPPFDGTLCEYVSHDADLCFKLPESVSTMEGCLIEPLAVGFHAANQGRAEFGQTAVIFGSGCIGLVTMLATRSKGIKDIIVVDIADNRLNKAKELGATHIINATKEDVVKRIKEITSNKGVDLAIETAGAVITANQCIHAVKKGGNVVFVGYTSTGKMDLEMSLALDKEITFRTVFRYKHIYPMAIEAVEKNNLNLEKIVTNIFDFDDVHNALEQSIVNKQEIVKSVIRVN